MTAAPRRPPRYTTRQIEDSARDLLRTRFPGGITMPVDIDYLLEREPDVVLDIRSGLQDLGVPGLILHHPEEQRFTVYIDTRVADGLPAFYHFTVAEELAHLRPHRPVLARISTVEAFLAVYHSPEYHYLDRNAKRLAASLLLPEEHLRGDARAAFERLRLQYAAARPLVHRLTVELAQRYLVSWEAMAIRLRDWPLRIEAAVHEAFERGLAALP